MHERVSNSEPISFDNFEEVRGKYPPAKYQKLASTITLRRAGLPVIPGFVADCLDTRTITFLEAWARSTNSTRLSLRFDSPNPKDLVNLSSLNPTIDELRKLSHLVSTPVIAIILAENDRYQQGHSVLTQFLQDRMRLDIVGPGFDAGDITRGKVSPHETFEIIHKEKDSDLDLSPGNIISHHLATQGEYQKSRNFRYGGIYATITSELGKSVSSKNLTYQEKAKVEEFLNQRNSDIPNNYPPLGYTQLAKIYTYLVQLDTFRQYYAVNFGIDVSEKVLSASFLKKYGLVFWDIYSGKKYSRRK